MLEHLAARVNADANLVRRGKHASVRPPERPWPAVWRSNDEAAEECG